MVSKKVKIIKPFGASSENSNGAVKQCFEI